MPSIRTFLSTLAIGALVAGGASAQRTGSTDHVLPADTAVRTGVLPNGLRYYVRHNGWPAHRAELRLVVNAGSVLEDDDQRGLAHFLEHVAFDGTTHFPKHALIHYLQSAGMTFGADVNAHTSFDETVYELTVPTDSAAVLGQGLQILEDWAHNLTFDSAEIDRERHVVIEEWRLGRGAGARIGARADSAVFRGSRYRDRAPIGLPSIIETATPAQLRHFYRDWYLPDLMAVVVVGDVDPARVSQSIRAQFAAVPRPLHPRPRPTVALPDHADPYLSVVSDSEATRSEVTVLYQQPLRPHGTTAAYRQDLVEHLYVNMLNARLADVARHADASFLEADTHHESFMRSAEVYLLHARVSDGGIVRGLGGVLGEVVRAKQHGFAAAELERARRTMLRDVDDEAADRAKILSSGYADAYVTQFLTGRPRLAVDADVALSRTLIPAIALDEIDALPSQWLTDSDRVILASAPAKAGVMPQPEALLAAYDSVVRQRMPAYVERVDSTPLIPHPPTPGRVVSEQRDSATGVRVWTLANGIRVLVKSTDYSPDDVRLGGYRRGGTSLAPDSLWIVARSAAGIVRQGGLGGFDASALVKRLAGTAVQAGVSIDDYYETVSGSASPRDLETMLELVYLSFTAPRADTAAYRTYRTQMRSTLADRGASPQAAYVDTARAMFAQHHPRARPATAAWADSLDLDRALAFYHSRFDDASGFTFVVVGAVDADTLRPLVERYLGSLPSLGRTHAWRDVGIRPPDTVVVQTIHRGTEPQSRAQIGFSGPFTPTPDEEMAGHALANVLQLRLTERLRQQMGGAYAPSVSFDATIAPVPTYILSLGFGAAPARLRELTDATFAEIARLRSDGPTADELHIVVEGLRRRHETEVMTNGYWMAQLRRADERGEPLAGLTPYEQLLHGLTAVRLREAAQHYLDLHRYMELSLYPSATTP